MKLIHIIKLLRNGWKIVRKDGRFQFFRQHTASVSEYCHTVKSARDAHFRMTGLRA